MKFVVDMNLGPEWIACLTQAGHEAVHWSAIGPQDERDEEIMRWAQENSRVVLTADLDFGAWLVRSGGQSPSVVQIRTEDTLVRLVGEAVLSGIEQARKDLAAGAILTVESERFRIRRLTAQEDD